jgi:hypothetical protein
MIRAIDFRKTMIEYPNRISVTHVRIAELDPSSSLRLSYQEGRREEEFEKEPRNYGNPFCPSGPQKGKWVDLYV